MTHDSSAGAVAAVRNYIAAFNTRDAHGMADAFNFPHVRLAKGVFTHIESRELFVSRQAHVSELLLEEGWARTVAQSIDVVHVGADKVHLDIEYTRHHADGAVYSRFRTLWIATLVDGHWGVQFRSSFLTSDASTLGRAANSPE
jgi:hypothetical protein